MDQFKTGDVIEHRLMPGFTMPVLDTRDCETDSGRPEPHLAYKITDPDGNADWLCAHDVQKPGQNLAWSCEQWAGSEAARAAYAELTSAARELVSAQEAFDAHREAKRAEQFNPLAAQAGEDGES